MDKIFGPNLDATMRALSLSALLLYLAPRVFGGMLSPRMARWTQRLAIVLIAAGVIVALAASVAYYRH